MPGAMIYVKEALLLPAAGLIAFRTPQKDLLRKYNRFWRHGPSGPIRNAGRNWRKRRESEARSR
jgi:hypothetical protein